MSNNKQTPKEKADELYVGYWHLTNDSRIAKQCAMIAVDFAKEFITGDVNESFDKALYLFEVKEEIEKL